MYPGDGIKVTVVPQKSYKDEDGFAESHLPLIDDHDGRRKRCSIQYSGKSVKIAVELLGSFNTHGASALHIGFAYGQGRVARRGSTQKSVLYFTQHVEDLRRDSIHINCTGGIRMPNVNNCMLRARSIHVPFSDKHSHRFRATQHQTHRTRV